MMLLHPPALQPEPTVPLAVSVVQGKRKREGTAASAATDDKSPLKQAKEVAICIVCAEEVAEIIFYPCQHLCLCYNCLHSWSDECGWEGAPTLRSNAGKWKCPYCATSYETWWRIRKPKTSLCYLTTNESQVIDLC